MSYSVNKVTLVGNLGANPEFRRFENGDEICIFSVATNKSWTNKKSKTWGEVTHWHQVVVRNSKYLALCQSYLKKGAKVHIQGALESRRWRTNSGLTHYVSEVVLRPYESELQVLSS